MNSTGGAVSDLIGLMFDAQPHSMDTIGLEDQRIVEMDCDLMSGKSPEEVRELVSVNPFPASQLSSLNDDIDQLMGALVKSIPASQGTQQELLVKIRVSYMDCTLTTRDSLERDLE